MAKRNWFWDGLGKLRGLSRFSPNGNGTALARGRTRRATSQRKRSLVIEPLECRQLLSVAPTAPDTSGLDACFLADLAIRTPHPQLSSDQPSDSARLISLSNYTASEIIDPGIPEIEPFIQAERTSTAASSTTPRLDPRTGAKLLLRRQPVSAASLRQWHGPSVVDDRLGRW